MDGVFSPFAMIDSLPYSVWNRGQLKRRKTLHLRSLFFFFLLFPRIKFDGFGLVLSSTLRTDPYN